MSGIRIPKNIEESVLYNIEDLFSNDTSEMSTESETESSAFTTKNSLKTSKQSSNSSTKTNKSKKTEKSHQVIDPVNEQTKHLITLCKKYETFVNMIKKHKTDISDSHQHINSLNKTNEGRISEIIQMMNDLKIKKLDIGGGKYMRLYQVKDKTAELKIKMRMKAFTQVKKPDQKLAQRVSDDIMADIETKKNIIRLVDKKRKV
jgi:hypothetical protein